MAKKISGTVARRYADALMRSFDIGELPLVQQSLSAVSEHWNQSNEFRDRFTNPAVLKSEKNDALMEIGKVVASSFGVKEIENFGRFLIVVEENGRLAGIEKISESFDALLRQLRNELRVEIITAREVGESEKSEILGKLKDFGGAGTSNSLSSVEWKVDSKLIGGAVIRSGDKEIDGSILGALGAAKSALLAR